MNFFSKKTKDTHKYLVDDADNKYYLDCDDTKLENALQLMRHYIKEWIIQDLHIASDMKMNFTYSMTRLFTDINIKLLPLDEVRTALDDLSTSPNEYRNRTYGRWQDTVLRIHLHCDHRVMMALKARFLKSVISELGNVQGLYISREAWFAFVRDYPWIHLLSMVQHIVETDEEIATLLTPQPLS